MSPDEKRFAVSNGVSIRIPDPANGKRLDTVIGHTGAVYWVGFSANGETVTTRSASEVMTWTTRGERKTAAEPPELRDGWTYLSPPNAWGWIVPYASVGVGLVVIWMFIRKYRKPKPLADIGSLEIDDPALEKYKDQIEKDLANLE